MSQIKISVDDKIKEIKTMLEDPNSASKDTLMQMLESLERLKSNGISEFIIENEDSNTY